MKNQLPSSEHFKTDLEAKNTPDNYPLIDSHAPLSLFYKKNLKDKLLYTFIYKGEIETIEVPASDEMYKSTSFQLFYVISGKVTKQIGTKTYTYLAGQGCLLNRKIAHSDVVIDGHLLILDMSEDFLLNCLNAVPEQQQTLSVFSYLNNCLTDEDWQVKFLEFNNNLPIENNLFHSLLEFIQVELAGQKIGTTFLLQGLVLRLLDVLNQHQHFNSRIVELDSDKENYLINRLITLIEASYGSISRSVIEDTLHYNAEYLNRLLKKHYNQTIISYAKMIRIQKAQQLLTTTELKVSEIAELLKFSSESYFYNYFKKEVDLSPKNYRLTYQNKD